MFFKKPKQESAKYDLELDELQDKFGVFINLNTYEDQGFKILSIEREKIGKEDETTVVYTLKDSDIKEQNFGISRAQHIQLISDWKNRKV